MDLLISVCNTCVALETCNENHKVICLWTDVIAILILHVMFYSLYIYNLNKHSKVSKILAVTLNFKLYKKMVLSTFKKIIIEGTVKQYSPPAPLAVLGGRRNRPSYSRRPWPSLAWGSTAGTQGARCRGWIRCPRQSQPSARSCVLSSLRRTKECSCGSEQFREYM